MSFSTMRGRLWCVIWALFLWGTTMGRFVVEKNSLRVASPASLKGEYESAIGNFGVPQYGGTMLGTVVYPKANKKACKDFDEFSLSFKPKRGGMPTFLLVDRGGHTFKKSAANVGTKFQVITEMIGKHIFGSTQLDRWLLLLFEHIIIDNDECQLLRFKARRFLRNQDWYVVSPKTERRNHHIMV